MWESVFTQTMPGPPPGAGVAPVAASDFVFADVVVVAAAAVAGVGELFGLKKSPSVFFSGEGDGLTAGEAEAVVLILRVVFEAGSSSGCVAAAGETVAAGVASAVAAAFLRDFFAGDGDASAPADDAGEASAVVAFFRDFLAGEADASAAGDSLAAGDAEGDGVGD